MACNRRQQQQQKLPHQLKRMKQEHKKFQNSLGYRKQSFFKVKTKQHPPEKNIKHTNRRENIKTIYGCTYSEYIYMCDKWFSKKHFKPHAQ